MIHECSGLFLSYNSPTKRESTPLTWLMMEFLRNDHQPTHKAGSRDAIASKNKTFCVCFCLVLFYFPINSSTLYLVEGKFPFMVPKVN